MIATPLPEMKVQCVVNRRRTCKELKMRVDFGGHEIQGVIIDLGFDVNILPKNSWEVIGKTKLGWSPIHLSLANQYHVY